MGISYIYYNVGLMCETLYNFRYSVSSQLATQSTKSLKPSRWVDWSLLNLK